MGALALLLPFASDLLKKLFPDPQAQADAQLKLMTLAASGELAQLQSTTDLLKGQIDVNKAEAVNNSLFVSGWRPFVGWICAAALGFKYIGGPLLVMCASMGHFDVTMPEIDSSDLMPVLLGMLGLGALRTVEKVKGVA